MNNEPTAGAAKAGSNQVGPIVRHGELAHAVAAAAEIDNPDSVVTVEDKVAYLRIQTDGEMVLNRSTIAEQLGRSFSMSELETDLASFSGRIDMQADKVRFYYQTDK